MDKFEKNIIDLDKLSRKSLVVKGNPLVQAKFDDLTAIEYKLIIVALSKITPHDKVLNYISFGAKEFCELLKIDRRGMYSYLKEACDKLIRRVVTIEVSKDEWSKFSWLHEIQYYHGRIRFKFHPNLEQYLLKWIEKRPYTKYLLENVIDMDSKHAMRLYELLKQYEKLKVRTFEINEFRDFLGISSMKYKRFDNLRQRILIPSAEIVNGLSDINTKYTEITEGQKVTKLQYIIQAKSFSMNSTEYELFPKLKIFAVLRNKIYNLTGHVISVQMIEKYHRIVLIELIKKFDYGTFEKVLVKTPNAFFKWHLDEINEMFDLTGKEDY